MPAGEHIPAIPEMRFVLACETNALMKTFFEIITRLRKFNLIL